MPKVSDDYLDEIAREGKNLNLRYMARELKIMRKLEIDSRIVAFEVEGVPRIHRDKIIKLRKAHRALAAYQEAIKE